MTSPYAPRSSFGDPSIDISLQPNQTTPRQLVIPDVDEPFLPLPPSALFVDPHQSRCADIFQHFEIKLSTISP